MENTLINKEEDKCVISKEEFENRIKLFKDPLTHTLLGLNFEKSQIDGAEILHILKNLSS